MSRRGINAGKIWAILIPLAILALAFAVGNGVPLAGCPLLKVTGWECPGCGGTRATRALLNGDIQSAHQYNQLILPLLGLLAFGIWRMSLGLWEGQEKAVHRRSIPKPFWWVVALVFIGYGVLRNVYGWTTPQ